MMLAISIIGVLALVGLQIWIFKKEHEKRTARDFFCGTQFLRVVAELLLLVLGVTVGMNLAEMQEDAHMREKMVALLEASRSEINTSYVTDQLFLKMYENGELLIEQEVTLGMLQNTATCNAGTLENILKLDTVVVTLTPLTYSVLCNHLDLVQNGYEKMKTREQDDPDIVTDVKTILSHAEMILFQIDNEIRYLKREISLQTMQKNYETFFSEQYQKIPEA